MLRYRYSLWDGTQEVFPIDEEDVMDQLSDHLLYPSDLGRALRSLMMRGLTGRSGTKMMGIQELLQELRARRKETLDKYKLSSVMDDISKRLEQVLETERQGIERRLEEARRRLEEATPDLTRETAADLLRRLQDLAAKNRQFLDGLPQDTGGRIKELANYEFMDSEAKRQFDELMEMLKGRAMEAYFKELAQRLKGMTPEDMAKLTQMIKELNRMLEQRRRGMEPDFEQFMQQFGRYFGPQPPANLDELMQQLQQRLAQTQSLLDSLPQELRQQLRELMDSALPQELKGELAQLAASLEQLLPMNDLRRQYPFKGDEPLSLAQAMKLMEQLQAMDDLERQLNRARQGAGLEEVDSDQVAEVLGPEARQALEQLKKLTDMLEEAGYIVKAGHRYELTPKGTRRIGQKALREIFAYLKKDRPGKHEARQQGWGGEPAEGTKKYEFGDPFALDLQKTLFNAVAREGPGVPLRLSPDDFEVYRAEELIQCSTALMLDLSLSMAMRDSFFAAKRVALALDTLMRTKFSRDRLYIIGFSTYAREVKPDQLPYLSWDEFDPYTNIQHGLMLARRLLSRVKGGNKQIILVSDGEPTAHIEGGRLYIQYPPSSRTLEHTLREVKHCTQKGILINTFMLDTNPYLMEFVAELARINRGRVFYTTPDKLGEYLLVDYLSQKKKRITS